MEDFLLYCFIKNSLNRPLLKMFFFVLLLYLKWPLWAFIGLYQKLPFSPYHFIENGLIWPLWKTAFIKYFLQYCLIKNGLYRGFFALSLHQKWPLLSIFCFIALQKMAYIDLYRPLQAFIGLYNKQPFSLYCFIKNSLYLPLSKMPFFALSLYHFI